MRSTFQPAVFLIKQMMRSTFIIKTNVSLQILYSLQRLHILRISVSAVFNRCDYLVEKVLLVRCGKDTITFLRTNINIIFPFIFLIQSLIKVVEQRTKNT